MKRVIKVLIFGETTQVIAGSLIVCVLAVAFLDGNITLGIYGAVFILAFYWVTKNSFVASMMAEVDDKESEKSYFSKRALSSIITAVGILIFVRLVAGIVDANLVDYCKKGGWLYSEKQCAYQEARKAVSEKYDAGFQDEDSF